MSVRVLNSGPRTIASRTRLLVSTALFGAAAFASSGATAQVQPTNGVVVGGMATIDQSNATQTVVDLNNTNSAINWDSFNVGANEAIRFITSNKSTDFSVLNRVVMANPSTIAGTIDAGNDGGRNIAVWLVNPTGVMFSNGASFSGGSLVLSTADIAATDFLATAGSTNSFALAGAPSTSGITLAVGSVINSDRGFAAIGQSVDASGAINNFSGEVALVAAQEVTLGFAPGSPIAINVTAGTVMGSAGIDANGRIIAQSIKLAGSSGSAVMSDLLNIGSGAELVATASNGRIVIASATEAGVDPSRVMVSDAGGQGGILINGALTANGVFGAIDLIAANGVNYVTGGEIKVNSLVANAGNAALQSNNSNVTLGRATTGMGSLFIDVPNGTATVTGAVDSGGAFNVAARGVVLGGTAAVEQMARGSISLTAGVQGVTTAAGAGSVTLTSNSDMDNVGGGSTNITTTGGGEIDFANGSILRSRSMGGLASAVSLNSSAAARFGTVDADGLSVTATSVTARGDITVRNPLSISSTGTTSLREVMVTGPSAGASLTSDGAFTADRITADGAVSIIGSRIDLLGATANGGDVQLTATSGNVNLGTATARDNVFVNASGNAVVTANVTAGAAFNVTAANITLGRASAFALQQAGTNVGLQLSPGGGTIAGRGALQLVSNSAGNTGTFTSIGTGNGNVEFGADTLLRSSGIGTPNSGVVISNGTGSVRVGAVTADVLATSATSASITADAAITTVNSLNLSATGAITLQSVETTGTGSNLTVDAGGALDAFALKAAGQATVDAGTLDIDFVNAVAGAVDLETNAGVLRVGSVTAGGAASLTKAGGLGDLIVTGAVRAGQAPASFGTITISSDRSARLGSGSFASGLFSATGEVSVSAINDLTGTDAGGGSFNRLWSSTGPSGDTSIMSSGNGLALLGNVSAQRNLTVQAGQIDALSGIPIEAIGGALRLTATTGDLNVTDARGRTGVLLESLPGNVTMGSVSSTAGSVTATANLGSVTTGNATAFGSLNYVGQTVALSGTQSAGGKIDVISSSGPITAMPGTLIRSNSDSAGSEAIIFDATGGDIMLGGATLNAGDSNDPSLIGIRLGAGANNVTLGTVDALSIVSVGIDHTSFDTGLGGVAGTVTLGDVTSRNTLNIAAAGTITANTINVTRPGQALMLNATGAASNVVLNGTIAATGAVTLTAGNTVTGTSATGGSVDITANAGDVVFGTVATTAGLGQLRAIAGNVRVDSLTTTGGDAVLLAGGDVTGRLVGTRANVTANDAGRDVRVAIGGTANLDQVRAGRDFNGTAAAFDIVDMATTNGAIALSASTGDISVLRGSAGTTANLSSNGATADVRIGETLIAGTAAGSTGNITLNSARDILVADFNPASPATGFVRSVTGSITATAARDVKGSGASTRPSDRGFDTVSAGGDLTISGSGDIRADELTAGGNLSASTVDGSLTGTGAGGGTTGTNVQGTAFFAQTGGQSVSISGGSAGLIQAREIRAGGDVNLGAGGIAVGTIETTGGTVRLNTAAGAPADPADYYVGLLTSPGNLAITLGGPSAAIASITNGLVFDPAFDQADLSAGTGSITVSVSKVAQLGTTASQTDTTIMSGSAGVANATSRAGALNISANIGTLALDTGSALTTATLAKTGGAGDLAILTSLTSGQNATISTSTNAQIATATAATGTLQVAATGALTGVMGGRAALEATAGNVITNSASALLGLVTSGTSSSLTTSGLLDVTTVLAGTNATLTGGTVLAGAVTATTGDLLVDATAGNATLGTGNAGGTGTVQATGDANVTTSLTATNQARVSAGPAGTATVASVTSNAANVIVNGGSVNVALADAATSLALSATNGDLILGDGDAGTTATLTKTGTPNGELSILTELTSGQGATISSSTNARIRTATAATGTLDVSADGEITGLMGARANLAATAGNIVLDAGTTALLGTITSGTSTDLTAGTLLDVTSVVAGTDATLTGGTVVAGSVMAGTNATLTGGIVLAGAVTATTGDLLVDATAGNATLGTGNAGGTGTVQATGDANVTTSLTATNQARVSAGPAGTATVASVTSNAANVIVNGGSVNVALADAATSLALSATNGDLILGDGDAGTTATLTKTGTPNGELSILTELTSGQGATISSSTNARIRTATAATGTLDVSADGEITGLMGARANLAATAGNIVLDAGTTALLGTITSGTSTDLTAGTLLDVTSVVAGTDATLTGGTVVAGSVMTGTGNVNVIGSSVDLANANAAAALNVTATTGDLTLGIGQAGTLATLITNVGDVFVNTSVTGGTGVVVDAASDARIVLATATTGNLGVIAGGEITGLGAATAIDDVLRVQTLIDGGTSTLLAQTGDVRIGQIVNNGAGIDVDATAGSVTGLSTTDISAMGGAQLLALTGNVTTMSGGRTAIANVDATNVSVTAERASIVSATARNALTATAANALSVETATVANGATLTTTAGSATTVPLTSTNFIFDTAAGQANLIANNGAITVDAGSVAQLGSVTAATNIDVTAAAAAASSATAMAGALNITATTGGLYLDVGSAGADATLVKRLGSIGTDDDEIDVVTSLTVGGTARLDSSTHARATLVDAGGSIAARSGAGDVTATTLVADEDVAIKAGRDAVLTSVNAGDDIDLVTGRDVMATTLATAGTGVDTRRINLDSPTLAFASAGPDRSNILGMVGGNATFLNTANAAATLAIDVIGNLAAVGPATLVAGEDIAIRTGGITTIADARASDDVDLTGTGLVTITRAESLGGGADDRRVAFGAALPSFAAENLAQSNIVVAGAADVSVTTAIARATFAARAGGAIAATTVTAGEDAAFGSVGNTTVQSVTAGDDVEVAATVTATILSGVASGTGADNRRVTFAASGPVLANAETAMGRNVIVDAIGSVTLGTGMTAPMPEVRADASIAVLSGGRIDASNLRAGEDIALDAVGQIAIGIASAGDDIVALSDGGILVRDSAMALGTGPNARSVNFARGTNGIANGGVTFAASDTLGMGSVSLTTSGTTADIEIETLLESLGDTRLTSSRDVRANTVRSTNGSIIGNATRDFTGLAMASAFGPGTGLRVGLLNDGGATAVTADTGDIRIGSITTTGGNIGVTATQGSVTGLLVANDVPAGSGAVLSANGSVSLTVGSRTALSSAAAGGSIGIGSGTISIGNANAGSTLALTATGEALSLDTGIAGSGATLRTQSGMSAANALTDAASAQDRLTDQFGSANLAANGTDRSITVQVANATKGAQLGMVSATRDVTVNAGAITANSVTAGAGTAAITGAINLTAATGALYLGIASARTAATLTKRDGDADGLLAAQTDRDELRVRTSLTAGGNVAIDTATSNRLANVTSTSGSIMVNSVAQTTGIGAGTAPSSDIAHGRSNLTANGAGQDVTVTSGNLSQLGNVSSGRNVSITAGNTTMRGGAPVNGAIDATAIIAGTGAIALTARAVTPVGGSIEDGDIIVGTGTAGTTATISNTATGGTAGDLVVNQNLQAGGNIVITSAANARLAGDDVARRIVSTAGKIDVIANGSVTGIAGGGTGGTEAGFGRANLVANAAGQDVTITSGAVTQAMTVSAGRNVDVRAGSTALGNGAIDVTTANAGTGSLLLLAQATNPGSDMVRDGDIVLGIGTAGTTATITNTSGMGVPGSTLAAALAGNAGNITVANSLTASQLVTVNAANGATLGATTSQTANVFIQSNQIALNGAVTANGSASEIRLVNRVDTGTTRVNGTVLGNGGAANQFALDNAEIGQLSASRVVIETAQQGNDIQDVSLTSAGVVLSANTGRNRFEVLAVSPNPTSGPNPTIFLNGTLNGGTTARTIQIGGGGGAFGVAETAAPSVTSGGLSGRIVAVVTGTGGGRILAPAANVELRAQRLLFGTEALRAEVIGLTPTQVATDYVANANSLLFDARGAFDTSEASQVFLRANTLTVRYRDFALFQNSAPRGLNAGIVLGDTAATGTRLTLFSTGGFPSDNAFAFFGTINNLTGRSVGLQSDMIIQFAEVGGSPQRVNQNQSRLNGCVLGAPDKGCLTTESPVPTLKLFDERQLLLLSAGVETPLDFDPLVSANNEALFVDFGGFALDPSLDDECPRGPDGTCVKPEGNQ